MLSRRSKTRLYVTIIRTTLTYGCEACRTTMVMERKLRTFEKITYGRKSVVLCSAQILEVGKEGIIGNCRK